MVKHQVGKLHPKMSVPCGGGEGCLERFVTGPGLTLSPGEGSDLGRFGRVRCNCRALFARERVLYLCSGRTSICGAMLRRFFRRYLANTKLMFVRTYFKFSIQATHLALAAFVPRSSSGGAGPSTTASSKLTRLRIALGRRARRGAEGSPFLSYSVAPSRLEGGGEESCCNGEASAEAPGRTRDADGERGAGVSTAVECALEGPSAPEAASAAPSRLEGDQAAEREEKPARGAASDCGAASNCGGEKSAMAGPVAATPLRALGQIAPRGAGGSPLLSEALSRLEGEGE